MSRGREGFDKNFPPAGQWINHEYDGMGPLQRSIDAYIVANKKEQEMYAKENAPRRALEELMRRCREEGYIVLYQDLVKLLGSFP